MKDVTKIISEKATRFLPVDMKDRLKSAFNRSTSSASGNSRADDVPDYGAIFNANRSPSSQKTAHFSGPLDQTQLAEPSSSATMRNQARQIAGKPQPSRRSAGGRGCLYDMLHSEEEVTCFASAKMG